jgi:hypothetical protein
LAAHALGGQATQGISGQVEALSTFGTTGVLAKAPADVQPIDTIIVKDRSEGGITYHYVITYRISLTNLGNTAAVHVTVSGTFDSPRLASVDSSAGDVVLTHLVDAESAVTVNATWNRTGTTAVKTGTPFGYASTIAVVFTNLTVSKATHQITGGTGTMAVTGSLSSGGSFSYLVTVTFLGNGTARLAVGGSLYTVDLATGTLVANAG